MKTGISALLLAVVLFTAAPAEAQLWFMPDVPVPAMVNNTPRTWVGGMYGRGLNDDSGEADAFGALVGRTGDAANFMGGIGLISGRGDDEFTVGAAVGVDVLRERNYTFSVQGGFSWFSQEVGAGEDLNFLRFPVGLAIRTRVETANSDTRIEPWVMPRLNIIRTSGVGDSDTEGDLGLSGGVNFSFREEWGIFTALDYLSADGGDPFIFGVGFFYNLGLRR
ncbi:MAG: hypothetical protein RQ751_06650 [Longimicrobiales bacterium]|nr:hypothetical protein [Longimicrobiales bacterium]